MIAGVVPQPSREENERHNKIFHDLTTRGNQGSFTRLALFNKALLAKTDIMFKAKVEQFADREALNEHYVEKDKEHMVMMTKTGRTKQVTVDR